MVRFLFTDCPLCHFSGQTVLVGIPHQFDHAAVNLSSSAIGEVVLNLKIDFIVRSATMSA